ncbi:hypothetical protein VKT23_009290 [Stygiomarasmius scandens]|uniref:SMODS and SLOG-associating 2TM effector domain-containing protein n=1 Tax=Marasmiellus scandens TaxID=2682957 RepID=A0ABR1JEY1_9AGAR
MDQGEGSHRRPVTQEPQPILSPETAQPAHSSDAFNPQQQHSPTSPRHSGVPSGSAVGSISDEKRPLVNPVDRQASSATEVPGPVMQSFNAMSAHQHPLPPLPQPVHRNTVDSQFGEMSPTRSQGGPYVNRSRSNVDWIIPTVPEKPNVHRPKTVSERLQPTVDTAEAERSKYELKAKMTGYALNVAIGLQVLLGALTTGLSAVTTGRQTSITTSILGGLSTLVASYLARARGSNEPELSITRVKDLEHFIRECKAFQMDVGHLTGSDHDAKLHSLRDRFEELLGNANGERRLAPPV